MAVPSQDLPLYNSTWKMFADLVPSFCDDCGCKRRGGDNFDIAADFLKSADIKLDFGDVYNFRQLLQAANILLTSLNDC